MADVHHEEKFFYFVDDVKYETDQETVTGALIKAKDSEFRSDLCPVSRICWRWPRSADLRRHSCFTEKGARPAPPLHGSPSRGWKAMTPLEQQFEALKAEYPAATLERLSSGQR